MLNCNKHNQDINKHNLVDAWQREVKYFRMYQGIFFRILSKTLLDFAIDLELEVCSIGKKTFTPRVNFLKVILTVFPTISRSQRSC